ncbi:MULTISPECIES: urease accessory protein UreE [Halocynthiibacter]|uniref:Urease accessory protein UreE n=1 Tax=Halocynthiibacter halioticoli TaxID=2986804 RepID=A0AAE3LRN9_9RHOB|nr:MULTISPECIES: urease accessory protein UreE [Halocynthiibacter]MCV6824654.1 urease accessory protein UreE [Halocynthiibacter halioticoli]MCW4057655.1 urease accessory protein UreE [Halocynthiibacter sp. SDUM655004]
MSAPLHQPKFSPTKCYRFERSKGENVPFDDIVELPYEGRLLRRKRLITTDGETVLLDLPEVTNLDHNDILILEDGRRVAVKAASEQLLAVSGADLPRLAWHIGNRHTPCQIEKARLLILYDHVLADMLRQLGATLDEVTEPFTPEGGAYGYGRTFGHSHGPADHAHEHDHSHDHRHDHKHDHHHHHGHSNKKDET